MTSGRLLSIDEVAEITGLKPATVRAAVRAGELAASRLRRRIKVRPEDLDAWVEGSRIAADQDQAPPPASAAPRLTTPPPPGGYRAAARARRRTAA